jgi:hypothetical protein
MSVHLLACTVCFSSFDPLVRDGASAGIVVLLGVTGVVLTGFIVFIVRVARRAGARG